MMLMVVIRSLFREPREKIPWSVRRITDNFVRGEDKYVILRRNSTTDIMIGARDFA